MLKEPWMLAMSRPARRPVLRTGVAFLFLLLALLPSIALGGSRALTRGGVGTADGPGDPPDPRLTLDVPSSVLIGEPFTFTATFDNASTETGYGPFIDLVMPALGADEGIDGDPDGISFVNATYLGTPVVRVVQEVPPSGCVEHPFAVDSADEPVVVCGLTPGDELVTLQLPFGSFTGDQPPARVVITAQVSPLADAGVPLPIEARGGFRFGATPIADPSTDPSILGPWVSDPVPPSTDPGILRLTKTYLGPEDETATGPNFPRRYRITVDIADGQTITDLDLTDVLPGNLQFEAVVATLANGAPAATSAIATPSTTTPGGTLTRRFASVTGTTAVDDAVLLFTFHVPLEDAAGDPVIEPDTADDATSHDDARAQGEWTPLDERDPPTLVVSDVTAIDHTLTDKAIAIQKSVTLQDDTGPEGVSPGDTLEWTLEVQVSDFFAFGNVKVFDSLKDGTRLDASWTPRLAVEGNGFSLPTAPFDPANVTVVDRWTGAPDPAPPLTGATAITFDVSAELVARGENGRLVGGCLPAGGGTPDCTPDDGPTTFTIRLRSIVQEAFSDDFPSGDQSVDQGDVLRNVASVVGLVLDTETLEPTGFAEGDGSETNEPVGTGAETELPIGVFTKSVYAVNGATSFATPVHIQPGDEITFRLRETLPTSDIEDFTLLDYLPLPVFAATEVTTFDPVTAGVPGPGTAQLGPDDTFYAFSGIEPTLTANAQANSLRFAYGSFDSPTANATVADLLFTVTVRDDPFADGLLLTNQGRSTHGTTNNGERISDSIVQFTLDQPVLGIRKGVVATDAEAPVFIPDPAGPVTFSAPPSAACPRFTGPVTSDDLAATPIDSDLTGVDAGDRVTFAITLENTGHADATDVLVSDPIPAGFDATAGVLALCVTDGAGTPLAFTSLAGGLAGDGILITDSLAPGFSPSDEVNAVGTNVAIVTFDLLVDTDAEPGLSVTNTASLVDYANVPGGESHLGKPRTDDAIVTLTAPSISKTLTASSEASTTPPAVAIGETLTFQVVIGLPEGTLTAATLTDQLDPGLAFARCVSVTPSSGVVTTDLVGGFAAACADPTDPTVTGSGTQVAWTLGSVVNADTDDATDETLTIVYEAVVANIAGNDRGVLRDNTATLGWTADGDPRSVADTADAVRIVEPVLTLGKVASPTTGDAGDEITFTLTVANPTATDASSAFDVTLTDVIPTGLVYVAGSLQHTAGTAPATLGESSGTITATWSSLSPGSSGSSTIVFKATLAATVAPNQSIVNTGSLTWSSLPGTVTTAQSPYEPASTERTGVTTDPGGTQNDHRTSAQATVSVPVATPVKTIVDTSESTTTTPRVAVGEIVRYRIAWVIPEGTSTDLRFVDTLPNGLRYLPGTTTKVALISDGADMTSSTLTGTGLAVDGSTITAPTFSLPTTSVTPSTFNEGTDPAFLLGNVTNPDSDANAEYVVIEFNALVLNVQGNQINTNRDNSAGVRAGGSASNLATSTSVRVTVAEPAMTLTKTLTTAPVEAGDPVVYTITIANGTGTNVTTAFDVRVTDTLDANLALGSVTVSPTTGVTDATSGNVIDLTIASIAPAQTYTITVNATVKADAPASVTIPNRADATWSSLPGTNGTTTNTTGSSTPGTPGAGDGERVGLGTTLNDYQANASVSTTLAAPKVDKLAVTPTTYPVGSVVDYAIAVTVPNGTTRSVAVTDALPSGMRYVAGSVSVDASAFAGTLDTTPTVSGGTADGEDVVFGFGDIVATVDTDPANDTFTIRLQAVVLNVVGNQDGTTLDNTASLGYGDPNGAGTLTVSDPTAVRITVIEPVMRLDKAIVTAPVPADAGGIVTYRLTVEHASASDAAAHDLSLTDVLPTELDAVAGSLDCTLGTRTPDSCTLVGDTLSVAWTSFPDDGTSTIIELEARIVSGVAPSTAVTNSADLDWTSLPGTPAEERDGADGPGGALDDHAATDSATFTTDDADLGKTLAGTSATHTSGSDVAIGEVVTYRLTVTLPEGITPSVVVTDTLPDGMTYVAGSASVDADDLNGTLPTPSVTTAGQDVDVSFGTTTVIDDDDATNDTFTIQLQAVVDNVAGNQDARELINQASVTLGSGTPVAATPVTVDVVEPLLRVSKSRDVAAPPVGDTVTWTLTVDHAPDSSADAFDASLADLLPTGLELVPGSLDCTNGSLDPDTCAFTGSTLDVAWASFPVAGGTTVITFQTVVGPPSAIVPGDGITNTASLDWTSLPGDDAGERTGADGVDGALDDHAAEAAASIDPATPDLAIVKTPDAIGAEPGDTIAYELAWSNTGGSPATGVTLSETVPDHTTFDAGASTAGWSCTDGAGPGTACTFTIGTVSAAPASGSVTFAVTVDLDVPLDTTTIDNTVLIDDDGTHGADPTPDDREDDASTPLTVTPGLTLVKAADPLTYDEVGDVIDYSYELTNTGNVTLDAPYTVDDDKVAVDCPATPAHLDPGDSVVCTAMATVTQDDLDAGEIVNTATGHAVADDQEVDSNEDQATVTADQQPALSLEKTADPLTYDEVGDVVDYTYELTNTGNVTLDAPYTVDDDKVAVDCPASPAQLQRGASVTCTASHTITQDDLDAGEIVNTATGHATFDGDEVDSNEDQATVTAIQLPALSLEKIADPLTYDEVGDVVDYTYELTNTGNVTLDAPYAVDDDKVVVDCPASPAQLQRGASVTCTASTTVTQDDLDAGEIVNTATGHATFDGDEVDSNEDMATVTADQQPALSLVKTADPLTYDEVGDVVDYTYELTNTGNVTLDAPYTVDDDKVAVDCPASPAQLQRGASVTCTASHTITQDDLDAGEIVNTATGHATFDGDEVDSNEDQATVTAIQLPALRLVKTADRDEYWKPGQDIGYAYRVTNTGNVRLHGPVTVDDDRIDVTCPAVTTVGDGDAWLDPGERIDCTGIETTTEADITAGSIVNHATATADGTDSNEDTVSVPFVEGLPCTTASLTFSVPAGRNPYPMAEVTITANGRLVDGCELSWSLASYATDGPTWPTSGTQSLIEHDGATIDNDHPSVTLRVQLAACYGQTDLYPGLRVHDGVDGPLPHFPDSPDIPGLRSWSIGGGQCDMDAPLVVPPVAWFDTSRPVDARGRVPMVTRWTSIDEGDGVASSTVSRQIGSAPWSTLVTVGPTTRTARFVVDPTRGSVRLRVQATDAAGNRSAWGYGPRFSVGQWNEVAPGLAAVGSWRTVASADALGGTTWRSRVGGDELTFDAAPTRAIALVAVTGPGRGKVRVIVDGVPGPVIDLAASRRTARRIVWSYRSDLAPHTINVRVLGNGTSAAPGRLVELDAFLVTQDP
jgi:fimbrial isopeptide formation D2 family protein/uncharacterized repeat protein (TIGR01451 family)